MFITVTSLRLRKLRHYFVMSYWAMFITLQMRKQKGFIKLKNTGFGYLHWTLSVWENGEDLRNFARSGKHLEAMQRSGEIAVEICTYTFQSEQIPDWKEAKRLLSEKGKTVSFP